MKTIIAFIILVCCAQTAASQNSALINKLKKDLETADNETKVELLADLSWEYRKVNADSALFYALELIQLATRSDNDEALSLGYRRMSIGYKYLGQPDSAIHFIDQSIMIEAISDRPFMYGSALLNKAVLLNNFGKWNLAVANYYTALQQFQRIDSAEHQAKCHNGIGEVNEMLKDTTAALSEYLKALEIRKKLNEPKNLAKSYQNLGIFYAQQQKFKQAKKHIRNALRIHQANENEFEAGRTLANLGTICREVGEFDSALVYYNRAANTIYGSTSVDIRNNIGELFIDRNQHSDAIQILLEGYQLAIAQQRGYLQSAILYNLSEAYEKIGEFEKSLKSYKTATDISDSLFSLEKQSQIKEIQEKYDNETLRIEVLEKDKRNAIQKLKTRRYMILSISITSAFIISILIGLLFYQRLQRKRETERLAFELEGQEQERGRIAQELHDGLGSLLSTVKHHFEVIEGKMDTKTEQYHAAQTLLDKACDEVRRISHDMASSVLGKFGLVAALQDLAEEVSGTEKLKMELVVSGLEERPNSLTEFHLFRIIQELVGNTLKHAEANKVTVQLTQHENSLNIIVEDNGIGFDISKLNTATGMGLNNLKARIDRINGTSNIDSTLGHGTTVIINVPLKS